MYCEGYAYWAEVNFYLAAIYNGFMEYYHRYGDDCYCYDFANFYYEPYCLDFSWEFYFCDAMYDDCSYYYDCNEEQRGCRFFLNTGVYFMYFDEMPMIFFDAITCLEGHEPDFLFYDCDEYGCYY